MIEFNKVIIETPYSLFHSNNLWSIDVGLSRLKWTFYSGQALLEFVAKNKKTEELVEDFQVVFERGVGYLSEVFGIPISEILCKHRNKDHPTFLRYGMFAFLRLRFPKMSLESIGCLFDRDHASVSNGLIRGNDLADTGNSFYKRVISTLADKFDCPELLRVRYEPIRRVARKSKIPKGSSKKPKTRDSVQFIEKVFMPMAGEVFGKNLENTHADTKEKVTLFLAGVLRTFYPKLEGAVFERRLQVWAFLNTHTGEYFMKKHRDLLATKLYSNDFDQFLKKLEQQNL